MSRHFHQNSKPVSITKRIYHKKGVCEAWRVCSISVVTCNNSIIRVSFHPHHPELNYKSVCDMLLLSLHQDRCRASQFCWSEEASSTTPQRFTFVLAQDNKSCSFPGLSIREWKRYFKVTKSRRRKDISIAPIKRTRKRHSSKLIR